MLHAGKEHFRFQLDRASKKPACANPQDIGQGIVNFTGLTKANNVDSLVHGVSLSSRGSGRLDTRLDTPHSSNRHHPVSRIALLHLAQNQNPAVGRQQTTIEFGDDCLA
jgi:hypothetical protein